MEWWYKNKWQAVTSENRDRLEDSLMSYLRQGNKPSAASLYDDKDSFFIKTTNKTFLQPFLSENNFDELGQKPTTELNLLFGKD